MGRGIINTATGVLGQIGFELKKHSPAIFTGLGIAGGIGAAVLACKATTKATEILKEKDEQLKAIQICDEDETIEYDEQTKRQDTTIVYAQTGVALAKAYAPAIGLGALSILSIVQGHKILNKRNLALAAAYTVVDRGFKKYRANVVERFGEGIDKELRFNVKAKEIEETVVDENGNEKTEKKVVQIADINPLDGVSDYARFFDESCKGWTKDPAYNLLLLRSQQKYANDMLKTRGYLFLNEVYKLLGMPQTAVGQVVGWTYRNDNPVGDNYVDFGIYADTERNRAFVNGHERTILLDFNVEGNILHTLDELQSKGIISGY